jgi:hypothetical protein
LTERRATIGRMDTILGDLRKFGFSLVTGLLTASSLVGAGNSVTALPAAALAIMVLVMALFGIDMHYQVLLSATVERAIDLESVTHDQSMRITAIMSRNATRSHATSAIFALYVSFMMVCGVAMRCLRSAPAPSG